TDVLIRKQCVYRRLVQAFSYEARPRTVGEYFTCAGFRIQCCKYTCTSSCHLSSAAVISSVFFQPVYGFGHWGIEFFHQALAGVFSPLLKEGRYCNGGFVSCQFRVRKNRCGGYITTRMQDDEPFFRQFKSLQFVADAFGPGTFAQHEHGHVRAKASPEGCEFIQRESGAPKCIQCEQGRG